MFGILQSPLVKKWFEPPVSIFVWLLVGGLLVRSAIAALLPVGFDEAYYYLYTHNLAWSYFDHPVMVAFTTGFGPWLTGQVSQFTIRIGPLLLYTLSLIFLYLTGRRLFSEKAGLFTISIASLIPIFFVGFGVLTLPDSPLIFFWSIALYIAAQEFFREVETYHPSYRLAVLGLLVGLACLSKYHGLALGFGLAAFCLTSPRHRSAILSPWMILAFGLFILVLLPIVGWNIQHEWISLRYQSGRAVPDRGYSLLELLGAFFVGTAYLFPSLGFPLWWVSLKALWQQKLRLHQGTSSDPQFQAPVDSSDERLKIRLILWLALPLMLVFTLMGGYRPILPTWPMPGFWGATLLLGHQAARWQLRSPKVIKRWLWGSGLIVGTLLCVALSHLNFGTLQRPGSYAWLGGLIPASSDASVQLIDIQQVREGFVTSPDLLSALQETDFVFTPEIFLAGQVGMAIAPLTTRPITCFSDDLRGFAFWSRADQWVGQNGLYLTSTRQPDASPYQDYFERIDKIGEIPLERGGIVVETIQVYEGQNLLKPYPRPYGT